MRKRHLLLIFLTTFIFTLIKVRSFDLFFYLKIAEIESFFNPLKVNLFSFSHPDFHYRNYAFLYSELFYFFARNFGISSLTILQSIIVSVSYLILFRLTSTKKDFLILYTLFLFSLFTLRYRLLFRPHNLSYLFFVTNLFLLTKAPKNYYLYLFFNQILWVNTHNGFILGILNLFLLYPLIKGRVSFGLSFISLLVGSLLSPNLYMPFMEVINPFFGQTKNIFDYIKVHEWQFVDHHLYFSFYGVLIITSIFILILARNWPLLPFYLFYLLISIRFVRFIDFFALSSLYCVIISSECSNLNFINKRFNPFKKKILKKAFFILIFFMCSIDYVKNYQIPWGYGMADYFYPSSAVSYLKGRNIKGNIFNSYAFGGYIIHFLYPDCKPLIDGRLCYPIEFIKLYADSHKDKKAFKTIILKYKPDIFLIDFDHPYLALFIDELRDEYALTYFDDIAMVFLNRKKYSDIVVQDEYRFLKPIYVSGYGELDINIEEIKEEIQKKVNENSSNRAKVILANILISEGKYLLAEKILDEVIKSKIPIGKAEAYNNLGVIRLSENKIDEAKKFFKYALSFDNKLSFSHINLAQIYDNEKKYFLAYYHYKKFLENTDANELDDIKERTDWLKKYILIEITRFLIIIFALTGIIAIITRRVRLKG